MASAKLICSCYKAGNQPDIKSEMLQIDNADALGGSLPPKFRAMRAHILFFSIKEKPRPYLPS